MTEQRVLVSGGAGVIGSHLCDRLVASGCDVVCVDNYISGRKRNIAHLADKPNFEAIRHDITLPLYVEVDEIYNLACPASPQMYQIDPVQTIKTSVHGAINMLGLAKRTGARILQASTSEIYGDPVEHPQSETCPGNVSLTGPRACYDEGKRCAETLFYNYHRQHGLAIRVARIFNTYGPRMRAHDGRVMSNFILQALRGEPVTIHGSGAQTRSFCYVDDMVDALLALMASPADAIGPVNLGNPEEIAIADLADRVARVTGAEIRTEHHATPPDDPRRRRPDIALAEQLLDWRPQVPLSLGLERTVAYFRDELRPGARVHAISEVP